MLDAARDVLDQDVASGFRITLERTFEQLAVLPLGNVTAITQRDHLIAQVFVERRCVRFPSRFSSRRRK